MALFEPIQMRARWENTGFIPRSFVWNGQKYLVDSTGRKWEDEEGLHILCMVAGGSVFELLFRLNPAGWWLKPPVTSVVI